MQNMRTGPSATAWGYWLANPVKPKLGCPGTMRYPSRLARGSAVRKIACGRRSQYVVFRSRLSARALTPPDNAAYIFNAC